jgi:hypothetical protein
MYLNYNKPIKHYELACCVCLRSLRNSIHIRVTPHFVFIYTVFVFVVTKAYDFMRA